MEEIGLVTPTPSQYIIANHLTHLFPKQKYRKNFEQEIHISMKTFKL